MIPILYEYNEQDFDSFGLCNLPDCTLAEVLEQRNGQNELTLRYPIIGANYDEIRVERIIGVYANDSKTVQGYRIYELSKPLNGVVTVYARHISSDLSGVPCPIIDGTYTPASAMSVLLQGTDFTGWSDIATSLTVKKDEPISVMSALGGVEGSLLDLFGGEYEFDNFTVKLHAHRGQDNGVIVEYGKNITQLVDDFSTEDVYSAILPYATYYNEDGEETLVRGNKTSFQTILSHEKVAMIDFTNKFDETTPPTAAALDTLAQAYIDAHNPGTTESNINVSFIPLWYDNGGDAIALCDTITIKHDRLGVDAKAKVVETVYDCLMERFTKVTCGKSSSNFAQTVAELQKEDDKTRSTITTIPSRMAQAIARATKLITGNDGGNVILHEGPNGKPYELLIMDNADITQAQNVWRWNLGGLGFSSNGYAGPYELAITGDGQINADFITTGQLDADLITTGTLQVLNTLGEIIFSANADTKVVQMAGFNVQSNKLTATRTGTQGSSSSDIVPGMQFTQTVNIAPNQIDTTYDYWRYSEDTQSAFNAFYQWWLNPHRLRFRGDFRNDPDNPRRSEATYDPWGVNLYAYSATDPETMTQGTQVNPVRMINNNVANNTKGYHGADHVNLVDFSNNVQASLHPEALRMYNDSSVSQVTKYTKLNSTSLDFFESGQLVAQVSTYGPGATYQTGTVNNIANETWKTLTSFTLERGTWLIILHASYQSNASGTRRLILSGTQDSSNTPAEVYMDYRNALPSGVKTHCHVVAVRQVATSATLYMNGYQGSGGGLSVTWSYQLLRIL